MRDDGVEFDPQSTNRKGGFGLVSMEERVRLVNGKIFQSESAHGGKIILAGLSSETGS